jgi:hypothetical protein
MNFDNLHRFAKHQVKILELIPVWMDLYRVSRDQIEEQIRTAHAWILANPGRSPKSQMTRFLHNWIRIAKQYGHFSATATPHALWKEPGTDGEVMTGDDFKRMKEAL